MLRIDFYFASLFISEQRPTIDPQKFPLLVLLTQFPRSRPRFVLPAYYSLSSIDRTLACTTPLDARRRLGHDEFGGVGRTGPGHDLDYR